MADSSSSHATDFFPRGAVAFFGALIAAYAAIWLGVYALLLTRSGQ